MSAVPNLGALPALVQALAPTSEPINPTGVAAQGASTFFVGTVLAVTPSIRVGMSSGTSTASYLAEPLASYLPIPGDEVLCVRVGARVFILDRVVGDASERLPGTQLFADTADNISASTAWGSHPNIGVAPCFLTMALVTYGYHGTANAAWDVNITHRTNDLVPQWCNIGYGNILTTRLRGGSSVWDTFSMIGLIDYPKGATMGFDVALVGGGAAAYYVRSGTLALFLPYRS